MGEYDSFASGTEQVLATQSAKTWNEHECKPGLNTKANRDLLSSSRMACSISLPMAEFRLIFSISTVAVVGPESHRQSSSERHDVDGFAQRAEHDDRRENG